VCYLRIVAFTECVRFSTDDEISLIEAVSKTMYVTRMGVSMSVILRFS